MEGSPGYAEWEAAEAQRLARVGRLNAEGGDAEEGRGANLQTSPVRVGGATDSSGSEGTSPVRSSYGRYLQARSACRSICVPLLLLLFSRSLESRAGRQLRQTTALSGTNSSTRVDCESVAETASPRRTPSANLARDRFENGGVTPPYEPPPFEQALRDYQACAGISAWNDRRLESGPARGGPARDSGVGAIRSTGGADVLTSEDIDDGPADDGSSAVDEPLDQTSGRAVARFSRDPTFELTGGLEDDPVPAELQWIAPWVKRGEAIKEVEELCGAGSVEDQLTELACQEAPVLREGLSNLRTQILNIEDSSTWPGGPDRQTEAQILQREADKEALDFFSLFTEEVLRRVEERTRKEERDRRQRELDGGGMEGVAAGDAWGVSGSHEQAGARGWMHTEPGDTTENDEVEANVERDAHGDYGDTEDAAAAAAGRTGIFVIHEGYLMKKTASKPHRYQRKWFSIVTKEKDGLVDSRTMQYYEKKPPEGRETEVEAAHGIILPVERSIEPYHKRKFRLRVQPSNPDSRVYCFQADTEDECTEWMEKLVDESRGSVSRRGGVGINHQIFLAEAREWILQVYKKHNPGKLKDVDVLLAEWIGEEEELLQKIVDKYDPKTPPPEPPPTNGAALNRIMN